MIMKRFIVISLMACATIGAMACGIDYTHNYYIFRALPSQSFETRVNKLTMDKWKSYTDGQMGDWYDADVAREAARKKGDNVMLSYIDHLSQYLDCASIFNGWDYPTKEELAENARQLTTIRTYAQSQLTSKLRSQHALLFMRCNMMLGRHAENVTFWNTTASLLPDDVYRQMMRNIFAGALLKTGDAYGAATIFVEQGDTKSLYTQFYEGRSLDGIRHEYQEDPCSPALAFLIEDFAKNAQEAWDAEHEGCSFGGKLFIRDIKLQESMQMIAFCQQVVKEDKTDNPALWKTLEAWLTYLFGDKRQALQAAEASLKLDGSGIVKDNARMIHLYIWADVAEMDKKYDDQLADGLAWLEQKANEERTDATAYENFFTRAFDRLSHKVLTRRFDEAGRYDMTTAMMGAFDEMPMQFNMKAEGKTDRIERSEGWVWNSDYSGDFFTRLDTISPAQTESYLAYIQKGGKGSALDKWLKQHVRTDAEYFEEIIGTKYIRQANWKEAIKHLEKVSVAFINDMNIAPYMAHRSYTKEPWVKRQRVSNYEDESRDLPVTTSQKLEFAREMLRLENELKKGNDPLRTAYELGLRYYQASYKGDCWYLTHYGTGHYDSVLPNEMDMVVKAYDMFVSASATPDFLLREKALYAAAFVPTDLWRTNEWSEAETDYVSVVHPESRQYKALERLGEFYKRNTSQLSPYVSKCDVIKRFID